MTTRHRTSRERRTLAWWLAASCLCAVAAAQVPSDEASRPGEPEDAVGRLAEEARENPSVDAYARLGQARAKLGDWNGAVDAYQQALRFEPGAVTVSLTRALAQAQYGAGRYRDALASLYAAQRIEAWSRYRLWAARCFVVLEEWTRAEHGILAHLEEAPDDEESLELYAHVLLATARPREAAKVYEGLLARRPGEIALLRGLARAHSASGENDRAIESLELATRLGVRDAAVWRLLADLYLQAEMYREAMGVYARLNASGEQVTADDLQRLGLAAWGSGELWSASEAFDRARKLDRSAREPTLYLGRIAASKGDLATARAEYRTAIDADATDPRGCVDLAELLLDAGEYEAAAEQFAAALRRGDNRSAVHYNRVLSLLRAKKCEAAVDALKEALRDRPLDARIRSLLPHVERCGGE